MAKGAVPRGALPTDAPKGAPKSAGGKGLVLVTGATGVLGSHVVRELVTHGWRVRAMTHRPDLPRARAIAGPRVEVVSADVRNPRALGRAVHGVDAIYLLEPWRLDGPDGADGARTAGVAVANAAAGAGVEHVVFSSLSGAGAPTGVAHLERKRAVELHLRALGLAATVLRPALLMERVVGYQGRPLLSLLYQSLRLAVPPEQRARHEPDPTESRPGSLLAPLVARVRSRYEHVPVQVVSASDVATVARLAFETPERYVGLAIDLAGDELTAPDIAQAYQDITGRQAPGWVGRRDVRPPDGLAGLLDWVREYGFEADIPTLRTKYPWLSTFPGWLLGA